MHEVAPEQQFEQVEAQKQERLQRQTELIARMSAGVDRDAVQQAYDDFRYRNRQDILVTEGPFYHLGFYEAMATDDARDAHAEFTAMNDGLLGIVVRRFAGRTNRLEEDDLRQEAWPALSLSAWRYDETTAERVAFSTVAYQAIDNRLFSTIAYHDFAVALSRHHLRLANGLRRYAPEDLRNSLRSEAGRIGLEGLLGREASSNDIKAVITIESRWRNVRGLDETRKGRQYFDHDGQPTIRQVGGDISNQLLTNAHEEMEEEVLHEVLVTDIANEAIKQIGTERDRLLVQHRFGLIDGEPKTLEEVGTLLGITRERVRQLEARAMSHMYFALLRTMDGYTPDALSGINPKHINSPQPLPPQEASYETTSMDDLHKLQARYHALGDYCEDHNIDEAVVRLALADEIPEQRDLTIGFYGTIWLNETAKQKAGPVPELRQPLVNQYITAFVRDAKAIIATVRANEYANRHTVPVWDYNMPKEAVATVLSLAHEMRQEYPKQFQEVMALKYAFPE